MEEHPFPNLKIASSAFLSDLEGRQRCRQCGRSRMFYCYSCNVPLLGTEDKIPHVKLPFKIDIIKHPQELDGKSTSGHAAIIAPDDVQVYTYPVIPDYPDKSKVLLIFPGKDALTIEQYAEKFLQPSFVTPLTSPARHSSNLEQNSPNSHCDESSNSHSKDDAEVEACNSPLSSEGPQASVEGPQASVEGPQATCVRYHSNIERVVFIDSTWFQVHRIYSDDRLQGLQKIELEERTTKFWRHQRSKPATFLATIEAIYYFLFDCHKLFETEPYTGQYDNLLFFFVHLYQKIRSANQGSKVMKAYEKKDS